MEYKILNLKAQTSQDVATELMFETVSAGADGVELIRLNITKGTDERSRETDRKRISATSRLLKAMKQKGMIQFFAFPSNFESQGTEARFLINKYPQLFESIPRENDEQTFVFIKL